MEATLLLYGLYLSICTKYKVFSNPMQPIVASNGIHKQYKPITRTGKQPECLLVLLEPSFYFLYFHLVITPIARFQSQGDNTRCLSVSGQKKQDRMTEACPPPIVPNIEGCGCAVLREQCN